ncbi:alpha/beta fold hydrolase [Frondihabitans australicus]|uniref:Pimeloyl-ACP methyl ester carboxylesterase n=1 Tax=Frondihabitans australicus TaxID=386892 RepID=A0A495ID71_9MICO|nr:alpha/beta fold hydrolase [Frondihabitans australicus]RKR73954.1 pimeloyl-ACP methyl ester carboxylesterase [Frondihabitans australicus]
MTADTTLRDQTITLRDGRTLGFAEWGDPAGVPIVGLHGTPGSRLGHPVDLDGLSRAGIRLVTPDRPGYGLSSRRLGRSIADFASDVEELADALGLERFAVTGGSGGGPHALAVAHRLPGRVSAVECRVGIAPIDAEGLDWFADMDPMNVTEFRWALEGLERTEVELAREAAADLVRLDGDRPALLPDGWELSDADRDRFADPAIFRVFADEQREAHRQGAGGWVDDDLAFVSPWGFDPADIAVPVTIRYGVHDVIVPAAHGEWLAARIPAATGYPEGGEGHVPDPAHRITQFAALAATV